MFDSKWSLPSAWRNGELTPEGISRCHQRLLPDVHELENDLASVEKSVKGYLDAVNSYCSAGSLLSSTFSKLLGGTTLSRISQQYQQVTEQLENSAHESCVDIANCVLATLCDFTSTLPGVKREIEKYKRCKDHYEKCREALESFAHKDASASEGKRFQLVRERFHTADKECTQQQEQLSQCLSALEGNRMKMLGASLLSLLHNLAQFFGGSSSMMAPLGEYQSVGDYLRDREIAPQLKEATSTWCSLAQSYHSVRESEYLSGEEIHLLLKHKNGQELSPLAKQDLANCLKSLLENYKKDIKDVDDSPVVVPGGFYKNPAGIGLALKGCCSRLETLALAGVRESPSQEEMVSMLNCEIPKVQLAVASVGKPWCKVSNLKGEDIVLSRQHCIQDLVEPLAKQFDIPFTKESLESFALTVLTEACSEKTILSSKIAVQLLYGRGDLVDIKLSPECSKCRSVRIHCKETTVHIEVQLTWWITIDQKLFSGLLDNDENEPLLQIDTTYNTAIDYMDYLEEKESRLPSITVELCQAVATPNGSKEQEKTSQSETASIVPVAPPRTKHYARKIAARRKKAEMEIGVARSIESVDEKKSNDSSEKDKAQDSSSKLFEPLFAGTASHLSLASESELSEVINFLSGRPRAVPDANDGDTESLCSIKAMSDSGIESVKNANLAGKDVNGGEALTGEGQKKGKKGKKKEKKGATKSESFSKKKKKKRGDKAKKEKKKAANEVVEPGEKNGNTEENKTERKDKCANGVAEVPAKQKEEEKSSLERVDNSSVQNPEMSDKVVILSESLRSVWELSERERHQMNPPASNKLSLQVPKLANQTAALYSSQDSIYHSCWSLSGLPTEPDEQKPTVSVTSGELAAAEYNLGHGWSKGYERESSSQRSIWSPPPAPTFDIHSTKEPWPPSLRRQDGVDFEEKEQTSCVGESVFSLGLGVTGFELFAAAKQAGLASTRSANERNEKYSSLNDNNAASQSSVWTHRNLTAGQLSEKSSSCGEGLHRAYNHPQNLVALQTRHSDPFLAKDISWTPQVPPMYMKVRCNANIITPFPMEDMAASHGSLQQTRTCQRTSHAMQQLTTLDGQRRLPHFYVPSGRSGAGPL